MTDMTDKLDEEKNEGWTLIEVLIAIVILTVGLLGVGSMQISAIRGNFMSGNTSIALTLASEKWKISLTGISTIPSSLMVTPAITVACLP